MIGSGQDGEAARRIAEAVLAKELGAAEIALKPRSGGLTNIVFDAETSRGRFIVRMNAEAGKRQVFEREQAAVARARDVDVRAPDVLTVGEKGGFAYMVAHCLPGDMAIHHPLRLEVLEDLGRLAARLHRVRTIGHGEAFRWAGEPGPEGLSWRTWLEEVFGAGTRLEAIYAQAMISDRQRSALEAVLADVAAWTSPPVLNHGDLRLKNVVVDEDGVIRGLIDWDSCVSSIGPHWDISIALHDLSVDAKQAFLVGYGLTEDEIRSFAPAWRLFNLMNYAPELQRLVEAGDEAGLDRLRTRLSGALDLYGC